MKKAIFPLSADPVTFGHIDVIKRAAILVEETLYLLVLNNNQKKSLLTLEERQDLVSKVIDTTSIFDEKDRNGVEVRKKIKVSIYNGLLVDFALIKDVFYIIRGIRDNRDMDYERELRFGHKEQYPHLEFIYLTADDKISSISSGLIKSILDDSGQIETLVPLVVKKKMEESQLGQYRIAVTGGIASGKSYICKKLISTFKSLSIEVHEIDYDELVQKVYAAVNQGLYPHIRREFISRFGKKILVGNVLSRKKISEIIFARKVKGVTKKDLFFLREFLRPFLNLEMHQVLKNKKGILLFNAPLIAEYQALYHTNNFVLLLDVSVDMQKRRLQDYRNMSEEMAGKRVELAGTVYKKRQVIKAIIENDRYGKLIEKNNDDVLKEKDAFLLAKEIITVLGYPKTF